MEKSERVLAEVKRGVMRMISDERCADAAYYQEHEFHGSDFDKNIELLRKVQDLIFMAEIDVVLEEETA